MPSTDNPTFTPDPQPPPKPKGKPETGSLRKEPERAREKVKEVKEAARDTSPEERIVTRRKRHDSEGGEQAQLFAL